MLKKRKIFGILLAGVGVFLARIEVFMQLDTTTLFACTVLGILLAFTGIAVYAAGMPSAMRRFKACPACFRKNYAEATVCEKCKKPLLKNEQ
jgi:uncharacterized membrane protein YidH (DUF202 family)